MGGNNRIFLAGLLLAAVFSGCENAKEPLKQYTCDNNTPPSYTAFIQPIMENNCVVCHQPGASAASIDLRSYASVKLAVQNNKLLSSVKWDGKALQMPQGNRQLNAAEITVIECWINNGMKE
ncbi:MAG: hypothetical protein JNL57_09960 [Bacteroidetes bacterium]|nr:hypothetical protein [Bacteroidota bacterium]